MGGRPARPGRRRPAGADRQSGPRRRPRRGPAARAGLRGVPDRSPPHRGRPAPAPSTGHARPRGRRHRRPARSRQQPVASSATASVCPGWPTPAGHAPSACPAARTCASRRASPVGTSTGGTRRTPWWTRPTPTRSRSEFDDVEAAPLLCAGIIGYRALRRSNLPEGGRLGLYGFGGSAHLTAQVALAHGARVHVMTRSREAQRLALELGASSAGDADAPPPEPLDSAILFAPVGSLVPPAAGRPGPGRDPGRRRHLPERRARPRLPEAPLRGAEPCGA